MRHIGLTAISMILATAGVASAAETATGVISQTGTTGSNFNYSILLTDTGTTTVGTFWYSWIPGQDFMKSSPVSINVPANWSDTIVHGGASDGYAIEWTANSSASYLTAGNSLTFTFTSPDNLATITGNSLAHPSEPVGTSFIYSGAPFSDSGDAFVVTAAPVPEPACGILIAAGVMLAGRRARVRHGELFEVAKKAHGPAVGIEVNEGHFVSDR